MAHRVCERLVALLKVIIAGTISAARYDVSETSGEVLIGLRETELIDLNRRSWRHCLAE